MDVGGKRTERRETKERRLGETKKLMQKGRIKRAAARGRRGSLFVRKGLVGLEMRRS